MDTMVPPSTAGRHRRAGVTLAAVARRRPRNRADLAAARRGRRAKPARIRADAIRRRPGSTRSSPKGSSSEHWLSLGRADAAGGRRLELDRNRFASGPAGGTVLAVFDDGRASALSVIDVSAGCRWVFGESRDVVRNERSWIRRADRSSKAGSIDDDPCRPRCLATTTRWGAPLRLLPPIAADGRFGPTWLDRPSWSEDGGRAGVASCGEWLPGSRPRRTPRPLTSRIRHRNSGGDGRRLARRSRGLSGLPCPIVR